MMKPLLSSLLVVSLLPVTALAQAKESTLPSLAPMVDAVKASVVNVDVTSRATGQDPQAEMMERFFGFRQRPEAQIRRGAGSGFIVDPKGLLLTNNHVVEGALTIRVRLNDGRAFDGEVLGRDPLTDLAMVRLKGKAENLPVAKLGDSAAMHVGDWVVAIGNPYGLASTVSAGIVSALDRNIGAGLYDQFLQTDAAINPGNSGGPLFNLKGEVVGINSMIAGIGTGIGFAVPSNLAKALLSQLEKGSVTRGWLGVGIQDVTPELAHALSLPSPDAALITDVNPGSPAEKGGMKEEDVVVAIDGEKIASAAALRKVVAMKRPDSTIAVSVIRQSKPVELKVKVGTRPNLEGEQQPVSKAGGQYKQPKLGVSLQDIDPRLAEHSGLPKNGALVVDVAVGSLAERSGIRPGMVINEVNRKPIRNRDELVKVLNEAKAGSSMLIRYIEQAGNSLNKGLLAVEFPAA